MMTSKELAEKNVEVMTSALNALSAMREVESAEDIASATTALVTVIGVTNGLLIELIKRVDNLDERLDQASAQQLADLMQVHIKPKTNVG